MADVVEVMARAISLSAAKTVNGWDQWTNEARAALSALSDAGYVVVERGVLQAADAELTVHSARREETSVAQVMVRRAMLSAAPAPK